MAHVELTQYVVEVLVANATPSPTAPAATNIGVTQYALEVLATDIGSSVYVSQVVAEVLCSDLDTPLDPPTPTGGGQHVYGYSG